MAKMRAKKKTGKKTRRKPRKKPVARPADPDLGSIGGPGSTTIVIQPSGNGLAWLINNGTPNGVDGGTRRMGPYAFAARRSVKADVLLDGTLVYGVTCLRVTATLDAGGHKVFTLMSSGDYPQWYLDTEFTSYASHTKADWNADLMSPLVAGTFKALVTLKRAGQPPQDEWLPASKVIVELE